MIVCTRYHDISCGHRVYGHESICTGTITASLSSVLVTLMAWAALSTSQ